MKIDKLIKQLTEMKKLGAEEVWFSNDEEGNEIHQEAIIDSYSPEIYEEGRNVIVLYPLQD